LQSAYLRRAAAADLSHLDVLRGQLAALGAQALELKKQQDASRAPKQNSSQELQGMIASGQRLAALLRQAVKQHYGPWSEKLAEFNLKPFRGRAKSATPTPPPPPPTPAATAPAAVPSAAPKAASDSADHA
jgi:hypothetical protein